METNREFTNVVSIADFPGPSVVTRRNASPNNAQGTAETVDTMSAAIVRDCSSVPVWLATQEALAAPNALQSLATRATAIHNYLSRRVKFRQDDPVLSIVLGLDNELELLISPSRLLTMRRPAGDCDDFTMAACAMLLCAGVPCEIVTIKADELEPDRFSHVYCQAIVDGGRALVLDCSQGAKHGVPAGWEAPEYFDRRTWGVMEPPRDERMHGYQRGMGCDFSGSAEDCTDASYPATGGFNIDLQSIINQGFKLASQVALKPGQYVQTAQGVMANQVPGAVPGQFPGVGVNLGGISTTTLVVGGVVVLGLALALGRK